MRTIFERVSYIKYKGYETNVPTIRTIKGNTLEQFMFDRGAYFGSNITKKIRLIYYSTHRNIIMAEILQLMLFYRS